MEVVNYQQGLEMTWRFWMFLRCHASFLSPHRNYSLTHNMMKRMCWWPSMAADTLNWVNTCMTCKKARGRVVLPQLRFSMADDQRLRELPWQDVIIDVQGPFTKAEGGEQYVLSYCCTRLKVPFLEVLKALSTGFV